MKFINEVGRILFQFSVFAITFFLMLSNAFAQDRSIGGTISLSDSVVADGDISIRVIIENIHADGFGLGTLANVGFTIEDQSSEVDFQLSINDPNPLSDLVQVRIICSLNCDAADADMHTPYYLQNNGSFSVEENKK